MSGTSLNNSSCSSILPIKELDSIVFTRLNEIDQIGVHRDTSTLSNHTKFVVKDITGQILFYAIEGLYIN